MTHRRPAACDLIAAGLLLILVLSACASATPTSPPLDPEVLATQAVATLFTGMTQTIQAIPPTPSPTATTIRTPPALPGVYLGTGYLNPLDVPRAYIGDTCQYLRDRWTSTNAAPGTVVMVIMFHSIITDGGTPTDYNQIEEGRFQTLMRDLHEQDFVAIDTQQLADFLDFNAFIPPRSVLLVVDDRHYSEYFDRFFRPYYNEWGWPVVNSWISAQDSIGAASLPENVALFQEGWVDYQAHGVVHNIPISDFVDEDYMISELQGAMDLITANFGRAPIAYIWPGGGFTPRAAELARQSGYRLGFTINPRGPLMYNWVPLADAGDPMRPSYLPEGAVADPRMVLPRFWAPDADLQIDTVRLIGQEASALAEANRSVELEYYDIVCAPTYGPLP
ncbi:MAG: polysaccharide deacetylase family protein [Anaerolineales bacterium]|nr:polysaccharide deacetylase family protein [Anaerolineales bacterium]